MKQLRMLLLLWAASAAALADPASSDNTDRRIWRGEPIALALGLGLERSIRVPGAHDLRAGLIGGPVPGLRIQSLGDRLFLLAQQPFKSTRMLIQSDSGVSLLLDLSTDARGGSPVEILAETAGGDEESEVADSGDDALSTQVGYVRLVRHAAHALYAPDRLIPQDGLIYRDSVRAASLDVLLRGARVTATALAAWRADSANGPVWVTAVELANRLDTHLVLDPRDVRGEWLACAFQHTHLAPAGHEEDTTTAYLVSDRPYAEALGAFARLAQEVSAPKETTP